MSANLENLAVATGLENFSFHSNPKERKCQRCSNYCTTALISHAGKKERKKEGRKGREERKERKKKRKKVKSFSCVQCFANLWTVAHQAPLSMGFSRQEYWSGLPFPSPRDLPNLGIEPRSPAL